MVCTFFGHRDVSQEIEPVLQTILVDLIENKNVTKFYVGKEGKFDSMVTKHLKQLHEKYPHITYAVVLAYMPKRQLDGGLLDFADTIYPEGLEKTPLRFAISQRNRWMLEQAEYVVTYVERSSGGAATYKMLAERKGKTVINLAMHTL